MENKTSCLNNNLTMREKLVLLRNCLDEVTFNAIRNNRDEINNEFANNQANILIEGGLF